MEDNDTNEHLRELIPPDGDRDERRLRPLRVPNKLYEDFNEAIPFKISYNAMMINLMVYYLTHQETVNAFINSSTPNAGQLSGE